MSRRRIDWDALTREGREEAQQRRERVLAWPDIAHKLTEHPLNLNRPESWSGYIPPQYYGDSANPSPYRAALIAICKEVAERERQEAAKPPTAPPMADNKALQILHIHFDELGIADRADRLDWLSGQVGRVLESSKELTAQECAMCTHALRQAIRQDAAEAAQDGANHEGTPTSQSDSRPFERSTEPDTRPATGTDAVQLVDQEARQPTGERAGPAPATGSGWNAAGPPPWDKLDDPPY